jgi:prolyl oligopeptidase
MNIFLDSRSRLRPFAGAIALLCVIGLMHATSRAASTEPASDSPVDPFLWLEDLTGPKAMDWVHQQNAISTKELASSSDFEPIRTRMLSILNSDQRIPYIEKHGKFYYNFWRDAGHVRGLWRRTTLDQYKKPQPAWEMVIDLDQLAANEKENWVWHGATVLKPDYDRALVMLSRGGADANVVREFDLNANRFVDGGFTLPEAKCDLVWRDRDSLYVGTDFGPGTLTKSGYPRIVKQWNRGTPLAEAKTVFEGSADDVGSEPVVVHDHGRVYELIVREITDFSDEVHLRRGNKWVLIDKPPDAELDTFDGYVLLRLRADWNLAGHLYKSGSLLAFDLEDYLKGKRDAMALFVPNERTSLTSISSTKHQMILNEMDNVRGRVWLLELHGNQFSQTLLNGPEFGTISATGVDADESDDCFIEIDDFLTPPGLYLDNTAHSTGRELLKSMPAFFNADGLEARQLEAVSKDGTRVPYFQVGRKDLKLDGKNPTLLYGYGGFEIPMQPGYRAGVGSAWLERGGVYVLANIRGGGEFGPAWHNAARKQNRQRAYDDFAAVTEDLIARKVTSPAHLGIQGGSNGGLLMGVMLTQRPDLFGAVVCQAPLLDMRRYNKLLAGASWMDEYGDPDQPADWAYIRKYSPYQNASKDRKYPPVLFTTSTRDDRVHPGHARKMAALLESQDHEVLFYENTEGGHGGSANNEQLAFMNALAFTFLLKQLR